MTPSTLFDLECDRLLRLADPGNYNQKKWERQEGVVLRALVDRIRDTFSHRTEFVIREIESEQRNLAVSIGPSEDADEQFFVLVLEIEGADLVIRATSGQNYAFTFAQVHAAPVSDLSDEWLEKILRAILANAHRRDDREAADLHLDEEVELAASCSETADSAQTNAISETKNEIVSEETTGPQKPA